MYPIKIIKHGALWTLKYFSLGHKRFKSNKAEIYALFLSPQGISKLFFLPDCKSSIWGWKGNVWSLPRTKSRRVVLVFFSFEGTVYFKGAIKASLFLQYRLKKVLKSCLKLFFKTSTCGLHHRHPKLHQAMLCLDLKRSIDDSLQCPAATTVSFLCKHNSVCDTYEVPWAEGCCSLVL